MKFSELSKEEMKSLMEGKSVVSGKGKGGGRKEELLGILKDGIYSMDEIKGMMGISNRNVSSVVCYLRDDGYDIRKIVKGGGIGLVLWGMIVGGERVGNRVVLGKGKFVRFNFESGVFDK